MLKAGFGFISVFSSSTLDDGDVVYAVLYPFINIDLLAGILTGKDEYNHCFHIRYH